MLLDLSTWRFISLKYLEEYFSKILGGERRAKAFNCSVLLEYVVGVCCWIAYVGVHSLIQVFPCWRRIAWKYLEEAGEPKHASPQLINSQRGLKIKFWSLMHINILHNLFRQSPSQVNIVNNYAKQQGQNKKRKRHTTLCFL